MYNTHNVIGLLSEKNWAANGLLLNTVKHRGSDLFVPPLNAHIDININ